MKNFLIELVEVFIGLALIIGGTYVAVKMSEES